MNLNNIDLNKIRIFHGVVKSGSYQAAGEDLGLTRSAISQAMTTLEGQIGQKLFQRKGRRLFPTSQAVILAEEFETYQLNLARCLNHIQGHDDKVEGLIRIGSYFEFAKSFLAEPIKNFTSLYPDTQIKFSFLSPTQLQKNLEQGKLDLCFSIFPHKGNLAIKSVKFLKQEFVLVAPKKWNVRNQSLDNILSYPVIDYYPSYSLFNKWVYCHFNKRPKPNKAKVFAASADMLIELVKKGAGLGVVPLGLMKEHTMEGLRIVRPSEKTLKGAIWLNQYKDQFQNSAHKKFYSFIQSR